VHLLVLKIAAMMLAVAFALPVTLLLLLLVTGFGDPGKQIHLPMPLLVPQFLLALLLPSMSGVVLCWWGRWTRRLARLQVGVLVGLSWAVLVGFYVLDWYWGRIGFAPPGEVFLINTAHEPVTYATAPPVSDATVTWGGRRTIDPGQVRVLRDLPSEVPLEISASDARGRRVFCGMYTPERLVRSNGRVEISVGSDSCP